MLQPCFPHDKPRISHFKSKVEQDKGTADHFMRLGNLFSPPLPLPLFPPFISSSLLLRSPLNLHPFLSFLPPFLLFPLPPFPPLPLPSFHLFFFKPNITSPLSLLPSLSSLPACSTAPRPLQPFLPSFLFLLFLL